MIRSRGQWVEWGEKPSAFFLRLERRKALDKCLNAITDVHGFGDFIVDLETHLTRDTVWKLAMSFDFAEGEIDKIQGADNPNTRLDRIYA
ncbi:hypothetical protein HOLleu_42734 [Holothuria leucospilota]|uniref:Uncharacterized protein n=1 Tax=Holothuria leucospilota TaxID=206669 RepID=A0A9Q0YCF1_HOLLE|nr:hypothetical protein HOLleu_42734 [Holothuria leucospilota]